MRGYRGLITKVDPKTVKVKAVLPDMEGIETDWLPVPQLFTTGALAFHLPRVGQQAFIFYLDDENIDGFILGGRYSEKHPPPEDLKPNDLYMEFEDGTKIHVFVGSRVQIETPGDIQAIAGGNVTIQADCHIQATADGNLTATIGGTATIEADGAITAKTKSSLTAEATGNATLKAPQITLDASAVSITGTLKVDGALSTPSASISGALTAGTALIGGSPYAAHIHTAPPSGGPTTPPV
jgi:phage baseplate assembly protein V